MTSTVLTAFATTAGWMVQGFFFGMGIDAAMALIAYLKPKIMPKIKAKLQAQYRGKNETNR